jgi:hypothetical protein
MYKCSCDVTLDRYKIQFDGEGHYDSHCRPLYDRGPGLKIVDSLLLPVASCTKASFKLFNAPIRIPLDLKGPGAWENILSWVRYIFPTIKILGESFEFESHRLPKLRLKRTASRCVERGVIFIILRFLGDSRFKYPRVRHFIEIILICLPSIENQVGVYCSQASMIVEPIILHQITFS